MEPHDDGTAGGTDREPLRGGMAEQEGAAVGPGPATADDPPAPYHEVKVPQGGLSAAANEPAGGGGRTPTRDGRGAAPPDPGEAGESARNVDDKIDEARGEHEREASNAPRREPS